MESTSQHDIAALSFGGETLHAMKHVRRASSAPKARRIRVAFLRASTFLVAGFVSPYTTSLHAQIATTASGVVVFEAEAATTNTPRSGLSWVFTNDVPVFSGDGFMQALPDAGSNINASVSSSSPELVYPIAFNQAATYRVWMRGYFTGGNDDSCHYGLNGATNAAINFNGPVVSNLWSWTNINLSGGAATMTIGAAGTNTFHIWMREDGLRLDRIALVTDVNFKAATGNSFHIPNGAEPNIASMRSPLYNIFSNTDVTIYNGNQYQGAGGDPGNQLQTGCTLFHKSATGVVWTATPMTFFQQSGNNKYFSGTITGGTYAAGETVQYYLKIPYSDHLPTFLYGSDGSSLNSEFESIARANPFTYGVLGGGYVAITNVSSLGTVEARLYTNASVLTILGPDLSGTPLANEIDFDPPLVRVAGVAYAVGALQSYTAIGGGLNLVQQLAGTSIYARLSFLADGVARYEVTNWNGLAVSTTSISAPSDTSEHFFGFGEKFNSVDQAGNNVRILTWDPAGDKGDQSYKVAPWFISTRGYGFHLDSSALSYFDMRASFGDRYTVSNLFPSLKFNVVYGPRLPDVLSRYTGYSGRPQMSPPWAYAPWISSDYWRNGGELRYVVTKMKEYGIPGSTFVFDSPWEIAYNDLTWNMTQFGSNGTYESVTYAGFASVSDMMAFFRTNGWKVVCWMTPFVNKSSNNEGVPGANLGQAANYAFASNNGYFVRSGSTNGSPLVATWWKGSGSPVDFTKTEAAQWWQLQLSNLVSQSGGVIGGWKTDDGETSNGSNTYIPTNAAYSDGRMGTEMQNGYSVDYHRTVWNVLGTNGLLFARSGFSGSQAYPGYWSGDNAPNFTQANGLQSVMVAAQSAGMSGYAVWASDIGGYQVNNNPAGDIANLFMRWTQFGAFSPLFQMHRQIATSQQYPWSFGATALENYRSYSKLHTALFPYIYTYAYMASTSGLPIVRHATLLNQADSGTYGLNHAYYFGNELYVAPATAENQTQRQIYLPAGLWYDFWTNRTYTGGQNITWTNTDQTKIALFVKSGGIIPMISTNVQTLVDASYIGNTNRTTMDSSLEYLVYPGTNSSFTMYDGTWGQCLSNNTVVTFNLTSAARPVSFRIFGPAPAGVERDGVRLPAYANATQYLAASLGWRYDSAAGFTLVKFSHAGGSAQVTLGPDTIGDGIPNSWRQAHFGSATSTDATSCATCDADGDGVDNISEYRAGTDPMDVTNYLRITSSAATPVLGTNTIVVTWPSQPGIPYGIGWKSDLSDTTLWQSISGTYTGNGGILQWYDNGAETEGPPEVSLAGRRVYRIVVP